MKNLISILIVNLNNLDYTKKCIEDLLNQDTGFFLKVVDQNSTEEGTIDFLNYLEKLNTGPNIEISVVINDCNIPLNHLWNSFVDESKTPYICFLNNDVRISPNFISSALDVFNTSPEVAFVNHTTNSSEYKKWNKKLEYRIIDQPYRQGWDPIFRRENYFKIPEELRFFYGDDYIYSKTYSSGFKGAYILNSPMIHYERSTTVEKGGQRDCSEDGRFFHSMELEYKNLSFEENFSKWKPEFLNIEHEEMKSRAYITHVTQDYLQVAKNLARSIREFSEIPVIIFAIDCQEDCKDFFSEISGVEIRFMNLGLDDRSSNDYVFNSEGNFYIDRRSPRIYKILCAKTLAMEMALEEGIEEVCYLDSDCIASPIIDELFDWMPTIKDYPICTEGIHEYMIIVEQNGFERGNPFEGTWPNADIKKTLEWPLMNFLQMPEYSRGIYRTTGIMLMNSKCLGFIKVWRELCFMLPKLNVDLYHYAAYHEETIYNVLSWKKSNEGFPLCYVNLRDGLQTVRHFYEEGQPGFSTYMSEENKDYTLNFYSIPSEKRNVKLLHGEKRPEEIEKIINYLVELKNSGYFNKF